MKCSKIVTTFRTCLAVRGIIRISNGESRRDKCNAVFTSLQNESITKAGAWFHQLSDLMAACQKLTPCASRTNLIMNRQKL